MRQISFYTHFDGKHSSRETMNVVIKTEASLGVILLWHCFLSFFCCLQVWVVQIKSMLPSGWHVELEAYHLWCLNQVLPLTTYLSCFHRSHARKLSLYLPPNSLQGVFCASCLSSWLLSTLEVVSIIICNIHEFKLWFGVVLFGYYIFQA